MFEDTHYEPTKQMKMRTIILTTLLAFSILLNVYLVGSNKHQIVRRDPPHQIARGVTNSLIIPKTVPFHWGNLESTNFFVYIKNLRLAACPEETVEDIVVGEVNKLFAPRFKALRQPGKLTPTHMGDPGQIERRKALLSLRKERADLLFQLLGKLPSLNDDEFSDNVDPYGFVPADKRELVRGLVAEYSLVQQKIYSDGYFLHLPEDTAAGMALQEEKEAELKKNSEPKRNGPLENDDLRERLWV